MRRNTTDVLRRGFDLTVANWPVIAVRIVETIVLAMVTIGFVIATIVPIIVSAGLGNFSDITSATAAIVDHWIVIVYALAMIAVLLVLLVAVHAFVDGGVAQIFIDSDRADAKPAFNMSRLLAGGRSSWWAIFWIYNLVWSIAGIILLVPLTATLALMLVVDDNTARIGISCFGLAVSFILLMGLGIIAAVWTQKAIAVCVARAAGAADAMRLARQEMRRDLGRHFAVAFIAIVVSVGGSALIGVISAPFSMMHHGEPIFVLLTAPLQIVVSFAQSIFSAAAGAWFLASFIALTEER